MISTISYVDNMPTINNTSGFVFLKYQKDNLAQLWFEYMQKLIFLSMSDNGVFQSIYRSIKNNKGVADVKDSYARDLLGIGNEINIIDIRLENSKSEVVALCSFDELVQMYCDESTSSKKRAVIDRFFAFLWDKGFFLYPVIHQVKGYVRTGDWKMLIDESKEVIDFLIQRYRVKDGFQNHKITTVIAVLVATNWRKLDDIKDSDIFVLENRYKLLSKEINKRPSQIHRVINELRLGLVDIGREDITKPIDIILEQYNYKNKSKFNFVNLDEYPNLKKIVQHAKEYYDVLEREGLAVATIKKDITYVVKLIKYLMEYYPYSEVNAELIEEIFEPTNEVNVFTVLTQKGQSAIVKFLTHMELVSPKAKKNVPRHKKKVTLAPYRKAMPKEMIRHIVDIIKNRPPLMNTNWSRKRADISWWDFEVYPIYPMMMLFGYYIPVRGEQVRNLCRDRSFIVKEGKIDTIVINTDKNVNRRHYQEIPCVWDDLQMFLPFLQWHKEYFKNLPTIKYHDDVNTPFADISPLFINPNTLKPISNTAHFQYHKKLLCQYQLEIMEQAKKEGLKYYPVVARAKKGKEFFRSIEELNMCSFDRLKDIEIMYDLHSLRVTGATRYLENGVGINTVMQLTGHTTPDTLLKIYINLTKEEKKAKLQSAIKKIYFDNPEELIENTKDLIASELVEAYEKGEDNMSKALRDNALFSFNRKISKNHNEKVESGIQIALQHHPSTWSPLVHGLCPAVKCPSGRENKCSLCPYLITGKLFIDGITLKANQAFAKFQRLSLENQEESTKGYKNHARSEELELLLEEILGWQDILETINKDLYNSDNSDTSSVQNSLVVANKKSAFSVEAHKTSLTYLSNAYDAKMIGVEQDRVGLKILTIKAMQLAVKSKDDKSFELISSNEERAIDYLMDYYVHKKVGNGSFCRFIELFQEKK